MSVSPTAPPADQPFEPSPICKTPADVKAAMSLFFADEPVCVEPLCFSDAPASVRELPDQIWHTYTIDLEHEGRGSRLMGMTILYTRIRCGLFTPPNGVPTRDYSAHVSSITLFVPDNIEFVRAVAETLPGGKRAKNTDGSDNEEPVAAATAADLHPAVSRWFGSSDGKRSLMTIEELCADVLGRETAPHASYSLTDPALLETAVESFFTYVGDLFDASNMNPADAQTNIRIITDTRLADTEPLSFLLRKATAARATDGTSTGAQNGVRTHVFLDDLFCTCDPARVFRETFCIKQPRRDPTRFIGPTAHFSDTMAVRRAVCDTISAAYNGKWSFYLHDPRTDAAGIFSHWFCHYLLAVGSPKRFGDRSAIEDTERAWAKDAAVGAP